VNRLSRCHKFVIAATWGALVVIPGIEGLASANAEADHGSVSEARSQGSVSVPLDSWIYSALDRLATAGLVTTQNSGLRPWTRSECRRQLQEAKRNRRLAERTDPASLDELLAALELEFADRRETVLLESIYVRSGVILGPALNDSYHFGQTWTNDFGRPYGRGFNSYEGLTARAESGRYFTFVRAEYQHAPGSAPYSSSVRETIARLDGVPVQAAASIPATNRIRLLDGYIGARFGNVQVSFGKQSMWWGPTYDAPLSFSTNAEPTKNLKLATVHPIRLPGVLKHLGALSGEFVIGKLGGHQYTWRPWFNAQKVSFKLTDNLEMGFTRWSIFWGVGHPITAGSFLRNFTSTESPAGTSQFGAASDPGDRKGGFDFRYRIPGVRKWLTIYADSYSDDDPSPLAAPRRAAINPGLLLARIPGVDRMSLRIEAPGTQPMGLDQGGQFNYFNLQYRSGNTNYGRLLGNSVGRDGRAVEGWLAYDLGPRERIEVGYRRLRTSASYLPGGGRQTGVTVKSRIDLGRCCHASVQFQYERFHVPALRGPAENLSGVLELRWEPRFQLLKRDQ
jgi:hypothetical protein